MTTINTGIKLSPTLAIAATAREMKSGVQKREKAERKELALQQPIGSRDIVAAIR